MQAQAAGASGGTSILQNPKVQIGVIAAAVVALIVVVYLLFFNNSSSGAAPPTTDMPMGMDTGMGNMPGMPADANGPGVPGDMGAMGMDPMMAGTNGPAAGANPFGGTPGGAAAPPTEAKPVKRAPGVPTRGNPFQANSDIQRVLDSVPSVEPPIPMAQSHNIYVEELRTPDPPEVAGNDDQGGPPIPAMRVAGIVHGGGQLSALIQMGDVFMDVAPGQMIPKGNPVYRVERIETDKVLLTRRWELGARKGVQRIEVALAHGQAPSYATPGVGGVGAPGFAGRGGNGPGGNGPR